jgi:hypothetical protein
MSSIASSLNREPESDTAGKRDFTISDWKPFVRNTLQGFLTLTTPGGMIIHGCTLHSKGDARWVGMPAEKFAKQDGTSGYKQIIEFASREARDDFNAAAIRAIDQFLGRPR